jgi:hypothetical protein
MDKASFGIGIGIDIGIGIGQTWMDHQVNTIYPVSSKIAKQWYDDVWMFGGSGSCMNYLLGMVVVTSPRCSIRQ